MSYQHVSPPARIPATVQRAVVLMRVGAACAAVNGAFGLIVTHQVQDRIDQALNGGLAASANSSAGQLGGNFGVVVDICCWLWMAKANSAGKNWARITGTVFFGLFSLGIVLNLAFFNDISIALGAGMAAAAIALWTATWLVGLTTVILLWNAKSGPYFRPAAILRSPVPPATGTMENLTSLHQPLADPWNTPVSGGESAPAGPRDPATARPAESSPVAPDEDGEASAFRWL